MTSSKSPKKPKNPAKAITDVLCFVLIVGAVSGLLHEWFGWIRFFGFLRFLVPDGYEVYGYTVMAVLGIAVAIATDSISRRTR
ncbi:hypothetical protein [Streptomyces sp. NPDC097619]|uniref:hypothetical protein n=1 Tax=Streptomyces sp. NPDC097619 TaxID=3157228 RepID=UPI003326F5B6